MSRLSWRSPENADTICEMIANRYTLRQIAREIGLSSQSRIMEWVQSDPIFAERYARAMELRVEAFADEIVEISDDGANDWMEREGKADLNGEHIQRSKLRVDTRKWLMAKMAPKKYGEKITAEHTGADGKDLIPPETDRTKLALGILTELRAVFTARDKPDPEG